MFLHDTLNRATNKLMAFGQPGNRLFWGYLLTSLLLAIAAYWVLRQREAAEERPDNIQAGPLRYIFDPKVYLHRSAINDYIYFILNAFLYHGLIAPLVLSQEFVFKAFLFLLNGAFGTPATPYLHVTPTTVAVYTVAVVASADFAGFFAHYLMHKVRVLWQFHQVHHSAEVMTPITVARLHPVDLFFTGTWILTLGTFAVALFAYLTGRIPPDYKVLGVNVVVLVVFLVGYNLRHSHIWVNFPRWASYLLISPAQHQIHHSVERRHWDKNFGFAFSIWDRLFGTLYYPKRFEKLTFGVSETERNPFPDVLSMYLKPFRNAWAIIAPRERSAIRRMGVLVWLVLGTVFYTGLYTISTARSYAPPSVYMEDLTWTEIMKALNNGYTRVIIPTGGTEQNGPHMILGKHNYIVHYTAGVIARRLGNTLVAPVITYVPEGRGGAHPTGHMHYPGTLTVSNKVFESIIKSAIESYSIHGFKTFFLVGESGPNQPPQAEVAAEYAKDPRGLGVYQIGDYYDANKQEITWLESQGYTMAQIGTHAGMRDTSELMAVHPSGVRHGAALLLPPKGPLGLGSNGDRDAASAEIGRKLLEMKIGAALRQIKRLDSSASLDKEPSVN